MRKTDGIFPEPPADGNFKSHLLLNSVKTRLSRLTKTAVPVKIALKTSGRQIIVAIARSFY
ncbi:hypothetical protein BI198_10145 [Rheinheimera salexigens]|uniref:Uncharacterized protein n=1 Tax=Rheinheimera salexigens TaxID=1628148 RepID=A0A1E7Q727_9GAMM|nr:hypothetical protein BI198_10145 [Rheinheimera salexigens]